jgi:hypothetical protein
MMPLSVASVQALAPHEIARGTTLISVGQQVGGSMGTALMSMILTNQFNRSEYISAANSLASSQQPQTLPPDFWGHVLHDLSRAYTVVFVIAVLLVACTLVPAAFLPKKPASDTARLDE